MDADKLKAVLLAHSNWLANKPDGSRADLSRADLSRANLSRALGASAPIIPNIDAAILRAIESGGSLKMDNWHSMHSLRRNSIWC